MAVEKLRLEIMTADKLPNEVLSFKNELHGIDGKTNSIKTSNLLFQWTQILDNTCKIILRIGIATLVAVILVFQNWKIFGIIDQSIQIGSAKDLQLFLGTLLAGTLTATYYTLNLIIGFLNREIDHSPHTKG